MRWVKLPNSDTWISEREANQVSSRIKKHDDVYYAYGQNDGLLVHSKFATLKEAKKWVKNCTGWSAILDYI